MNEGDDGHIIDGDVESFAKHPPSVTAPPYGKGDTGRKLE